MRASDVTAGFFHWRSKLIPKNAGFNKTLFFLAVQFGLIIELIAQVI